MRTFKLIRFDNGNEMITSDNVDITYGNIKNGKKVIYNKTEEIPLDGIDEKEIQQVIDNPSKMAIDKRSGKAVKKSGKIKVINHEIGKKS